MILPNEEPEVKLTRFTEDTANYLSMEILPYLVGNESLEMNDNQSKFVKNHLVKHIKLG